MRTNPAETLAKDASLVRQIKNKGRNNRQQSQCDSSGGSRGLGAEYGGGTLRPD